MGVEESHHEDLLVEHAGKKFASFKRFYKFNSFLEIDDIFLTPTTKDALQTLRRLKYLDVRIINGELMYALRGKAVNPKLYRIQKHKPLPTTYFYYDNEDEDGNPIVLH